jgi:hypothetical protein
MKRTHLLAALLSVIVLVSIAAVGSSGWTSARVYSAKRLYTYSNRTDTSAAINTLGREHVEVATTTTGTDSLYLRSHVQYRIGSTWITAVRDTIRFGDATTTTGKGRGFIVNRPGAATLTPGSAQIRILNTVVPYPGADSTGVASYTQNVILY